MQSFCIPNFYLRKASNEDNNVRVESMERTLENELEFLTGELDKPH